MQREECDPPSKERNVTLHAKKEMPIYNGLFGLQMFYFDIFSIVSFQQEIRE